MLFVQIDNNAFIGGGAVVHQFCRIGELAMLGGLAGIGMDVPPFFMAVHFGECAGINSVGIKRAGFSTEERQELREAYRLLYRSGMLFSDAVKQVIETAKTSPGRKLAEFLGAPSKRGILPPPRFTRSGEQRAT
jgi:UDP-N-acetylglucosamine acyltransferase